MFFDVKKVLITVAIVVGVMAVVIGGFLYAAGFFALGEQEDLYRGVVSPRHMIATYVEPMDAETAELLYDTENAGVVSGGGQAGSDSDADADGGAAAASQGVKALLFQDGKLVASGNVNTEDRTFSLTKAVDLMGVRYAGDYPHLNAERDLLTYEEVEAILAAGGVFRIASGGAYITGDITPASSVYVE
jgi:hypothetical protein